MRCWGQWGCLRMVCVKFMWPLRVLSHISGAVIDTESTQKRHLSRARGTTPHMGRYVKLGARRNNTVMALQLNNHLQGAHNVIVSKHTIYRRLGILGRWTSVWFLVRFSKGTSLESTWHKNPTCTGGSHIQRDDVKDIPKICRHLQKLGVDGDFKVSHSYS